MSKESGYIIGITGASGVIYGIRTLEELKKKGVPTHLIISKWGGITIEKETEYSLEQIKALAAYTYPANDLSTCLASGSFKTAGMIVVPCSMKTLAAIANGYAEDLIARAADVTIKEKRKLVLMVRESPLSPIHLENMLKLARIGVTIMPPLPAFYSKPQDLNELINHTVWRLLDHLGMEVVGLKRWDIQNTCE